MFIELEAAAAAAAPVASLCIDVIQSNVPPQRAFGNGAQVEVVQLRQDEDHLQRESIIFH